MAAATYYFGLAFLISFAPSTISESRWTYDRLWSQADSVVIGTIQTTRLCENEDNFFSEYLDCQQSTIMVHAVLKGDPDLGTLEFIHFKYKPDATIRIGNGPRFPMLRAFNTTTLEEVEQHDLVFLFFLAKRDDRRFDPVSGHSDAHFSVARIDGFAFPPNSD